MKRNTYYHKAQGKNSLQQWWKAKNPLSVIFNFCYLRAAQFMPSLSLKNSLYRLVGMKIGKDVSISPGVTIDFFFPELIEIGDNTIIGYGATLLAHEFLVKEWRTGKVKIGKNCMIGANATILAGVEIGDNSTVSALALVNKSIPENSFFSLADGQIVKKK